MSREINPFGSPVEQVGAGFEPLDLSVKAKMAMDKLSSTDSRTRHQGQHLASYCKSYFMNPFVVSGRVLHEDGTVSSDEISITTRQLADVDVEGVSVRLDSENGNASKIWIDAASLVISRPTHEQQ